MNLNQWRSTSLRVLATDLDGTLIPLPGSKENARDLAELTKKLEDKGREIVFATGRHFESVLDATLTYGLPRPSWMVCDVGSSIFFKKENEYTLYQPYENHLRDLVQGCGREVVLEHLQGKFGLKLQPEECQRPYKISFFCQAEDANRLAKEINQLLRERDLPFDCMGSVDPFENVGLLDVLPLGVSKASALLWLATHADFLPEEVVFSGDSGNDYAALVSGFHSILVGNASDEVRSQVQGEMERRNEQHLLYQAKKSATSGVLEGCMHYGLV